MVEAGLRTAAMLSGGDATTPLSTAIRALRSLNGAVGAAKHERTTTKAPEDHIELEEQVIQQSEEIWAAKDMDVDHEDQVSETMVIADTVHMTICTPPRSPRGGKKWASIRPPRVDSNAAPPPARGHCGQFRGRQGH